MPENLGTAFMLAPGTGKLGEPLRKNTWHLQIQGVEDISLHAKRCSLPREEVEIHEIHYFNEKTKIAGKPTISDVRVVVNDVLEPDLVQKLWEWYQQVRNSNTAEIGYASEYKREGYLFLRDSKGNLVRRWRLQGAFPKNNPTSEDELDYSNSEPQQVDLVLVIDRATLD